MGAPRLRRGLWGWVAVFALAAAVPLLKPTGYVYDIGINVMLYSVLAYGMNVLLGYTGQLPLAHAGFYGIGAYAVGLLTLKQGWSFWAAWPAAVLLCMALGYLLGLVAFRTRGDAFSIFTLGVGVIITSVINKWDALTGGNEGLNGINPPQGLEALSRSLGLTLNGGFYYLALLTLLLTVVLVARLRGSVFGRSLLAIRGSEDLARSAGVNVFAHKLRAMMFSTGLAGLAGGLYAGYAGFLGAAFTGPLTTFTVLLHLLVGGLGSLAGPLVGPALMYGLAQGLRGLEDYQYIVFGPLLVLIVMFAPQGLVGLWERWRARRQGGGHA